MSVRPVPAAWMESTAARRSRLFWKSFTRACRALVFTLPSMRMYLVFVLQPDALSGKRDDRLSDGEGLAMDSAFPCQHAAVEETPPLFRCWVPIFRAREGSCPD